MASRNLLNSTASRGLLLGLLLASLTTTPAAASLRQGDLLRAVNAARTERGLAPLRLDVRLSRAARAHTRDMLRQGYFRHESGPLGQSFDRRLERFRPGLTAAGEVMVRFTGEASSELAVEMWLASPPHRAVLLSPAFTRVGFGIGRGTLLGRAGVTACTADLGRSGP